MNRFELCNQYKKLFQLKTITDYVFAITKLQSKRPDGIPISRSISLIFKTNDDCHGNWSCSVCKGVAGVRMWWEARILNLIFFT